MPLADEEVLRCEQCGAPLATAAAPGTISSCLNCLLLGARRSEGNECLVTVICHTSDNAFYKRSIELNNIVA